MNAIDGSENYERVFDDSPPSLLTIILDTNPAAWYRLADHLSISEAVSDLLIFVNAHLACNYANKVAVIASHCATAKWLYPSPSIQAELNTRPSQTQRAQQGPGSALTQTGAVNGTDRQEVTKRPQSTTKIKLKVRERRTDGQPGTSNKYEPFRQVEEEVLRNLSDLLATTTASEVARTTSTMIAGALTLALSHINRETIAYADANGGGSRGTATEPGTQPNTAINASSCSQALQAKIFILSVSPSTDLAHQYIPIMNSIFACQRLSIPIDICQVPLPSATTALGRSSITADTSTTSTSTVFLQQASDATHGIYIPLPSPSATGSQPQRRDGPTWSLLQYLLFAFLPTNSTRRLLILPTRIDVDFRAACFCHRRVVDIGFVCSICLSIFCSVPEGGLCLTCGAHLTLGEYGARPLVVSRGPGKKKKKRKALDGSSNAGTPIATPTPGAS